nr:MAG TPA: adenine specific DNA methyltransferase [Caudoviricetes sp.]
MMKIELLAIDKIKMYENNAKLHPREQIEQIKKSILEFGNNDPIAVDEHNVIIEGHGRSNFNNVLHFSRTSGDERESAGRHATPKPLALVSLMLKSSTREGDVVLDVFGGSGSTLIACERLGRTCYINELEPKYVDLIIRRWEKETGREAVKLN